MNLERHSTPLYLRPRFVQGVSVLCLLVILFGMTWNDAPTLNELEVYQQGVQALRGEGVSQPLTLGASLISVSWYSILQNVSGFTLPDPMNIQTFEEVRLVLILLRIPFVMALITALIWITDMVWRYTKSLTATNTVTLLVAFSPLVLALGGLVQSGTLLMVGSIMLVDTWLTLQSKSTRLGWIEYGLLAAVWVFLVPSLILVIAGILLFWLFDWVGVQSKTADMQYFRTVGALGYWVLFTLGMTQLVYSFTARGSENQWFIADIYTSFSQYMKPEPVLIFSRWLEYDWGLGTIFSYLLKEPFSLLYITWASLAFGFFWSIRHRRELTRQTFLQHRFTLILVWFIFLGFLGAILVPGVTTVVTVWIVLIPLYALVAIIVSRVLIPEQFSKTILVGLLVYYIGGTLWTYPHYLSHTNIFTGTGDLTYLMIAGEHIDGGQDGIRLAQWTKQQNIDTMYIDYQGSLSLDTLMPEVFINNTSDSGENTNDYIAIGVNRFHQTLREYQQGLRTQDYWWLRWRHPDYQVGKSIIVYKPKESK